MKKKILVLQPNYKAVSETWLERMTEILQDNIFAIGAFNPSEKMWRNKIPVFDLGKPKYTIWQRVLLKFSMKLVPNPKKLVEKQILKMSRKVDVVFIHFIGPALYFKEILKKIDKPIFVHVHGADIFWNLKSINSEKKSYFDENYADNVKELSKRAKFIANSKFSIKQLEKIGIDESKIYLKYFGVPVQKKKQYLEKKQLIVLFLGRLVDFKAPDIVIQAFELAKQKGLNAKLIIAGDGPLRITCELLKFHSKYKKDIDILGAVNYKQAHKLYKQADIYTMHNVKGPITNQEEAFGVSLIEAMSYGLPIVTARSGAIEETVAHKETGFIVNPFDIEAHANAFIDLQNLSLRKKMGCKSQEIVKTFFNPEQEKERLREILEL